MWTILTKIFDVVLKKGNIYQTRISIYFNKIRKSSFVPNGTRKESWWFNFDNKIAKLHRLIVLIKFFSKWKFNRLMDFKILAPRSDRTVELIYISVLLAHKCLPCLLDNIYLSFLHIIVLLVYEKSKCCHLWEKDWNYLGSEMYYHLSDFSILPF